MSCPGAAEQKGQRLQVWTLVPVRLEEELSPTLTAPSSAAQDSVSLRREERPRTVLLLELGSGSLAGASEGFHTACSQRGRARRASFLHMAFEARGEGASFGFFHVVARCLAGLGLALRFLSRVNPTSSSPAPPLTSRAIPGRTRDRNGGPALHPRPRGQSTPSAKKALIALGRAPAWPD